MKRREFIASSAVLGAAGLAPPLASASIKPGGGLDQRAALDGPAGFSQALFENLKDRRFDLKHRQWRYLPMRMVQVESGKSQQSLEQFDVIFRLDASERVDEGLHRLVNGELGGLELFLSSAEVSHGSGCYRATFSLLRNGLI